MRGGEELRESRQVTERRRKRETAAREKDIHAEMEDDGRGGEDIHMLEGGFEDIRMEEKEESRDGI